jgi:hypothetical protein
MDIIEIIERNQFLKTLFPDGLTTKIVLGKLELRVDDRITLNIHTQQKPAKENHKWGVWGKDYNTIVIQIDGFYLKKIEVNNWQNAKPCLSEVTNAEDIKKIIFKGDNWLVNIEVGSLIFQNCSTYEDIEFETI